ncbi:unnamed protein product [Rhizopus stolonifer]
MTRAIYAFEQLKACVEKLEQNENTTLPTMLEIINYCLTTPPLLTLQDSPLHILQDSKIPYSMVRDWYIGNSLDYIEDSLSVLLEQWEKTYKKKRHDPEQIANQFVRLVNNVHECFENTQLALNMSLSEDNALASVELKDKLKRVSIELIQKMVSDKFRDAQEIYRQRSLEYLKQLLLLKNQSFVTLFAYDLKYQGRELEYILSLDAEFIDRANKEARLNYDESDNITKEDIKTLTLDVGDCKSMTFIESQFCEFRSVYEKINALSLGPNWVSMLKQLIQERLSSEVCPEDESMVQSQLKWLHVLVLPWMSYIMPNSGNKEDNWIEFLRQKIIAEHTLYHAIYQRRITTVLDIIWDAPEAKGALLDLQITANRCKLLNDLQNNLVQELKGRLLHLGVSVCDILECTHRINVAQAVVDIIRSPESHNVELRTLHDNPYMFTSEELERVNFKSNTVEKDILGNLKKLQEQSADVTATLISMCNPLKGFATAYSEKLGEVLFYTKEYDVDAEILSLEVLKLNFPPDTFTHCDIMLKDISDSKRTDKAIHGNIEIDPTLHPIIISKKYWPEEDDNNIDRDNEDFMNALFKLWPDYKRDQEKYKKEYGHVKASRKLKFLPNLGTVTLDLVFKSGRENSFVVRPEAAAIIKLFENDDAAFTKEEMMSKLKIKKKVAVDCLNTWVEGDVLQLNADGKYSLVEV